MTRPELRSFAGLVRMWIEPSSTQQYYPLAHSAFWLQQRIWGDWFPGYHLVNIMLHVLAALLFLAILRHFDLPGAWLAAAIFALHPVHVESVAWITELKNTLSGVLYLASALAFFKFDRSRSKFLYAMALLLFALALMAKTAIATLPAAILVVLWWKRGRLSWRTDVLPLTPFFLAALGAGAVTAYVEQKIYGAQGSEFTFSFIERCLIAGRSVWFHLGSLFWPVNLAFMYPRWRINSADPSQYLFPALTLIVLTVFWAIRGKNRGPLAAVLFFGGTLFPALGFFNAYSFRYCFVNDHHQYLASLGIISLFAASVALFFQRFSPKKAQVASRFGVFGQYWPGPAFRIALLAALAGLTARQCASYSDLETLWRDTLAKQPDCWMAMGSLGKIRLDQRRYDDAIALFESALRLKPDAAELENNLGLALVHQRKPGAEKHFLNALRIDPTYPNAHQNYADLLLEQGNATSAIDHYRRVLDSDGRDVSNDHQLHNNLATALSRVGRIDEAIAHYRESIRIKPNELLPLNNLAALFIRQGGFNQAIECLQSALTIQPDSAPLHFELGNLHSRQTNTAQAIAHWRRGLEIKPDSPDIANNLAWSLAVSTNDTLRNGAEALVWAERACKLNGTPDHRLLDTLAAAYAEVGRFDNAIHAIRQAIALADSAGRADAAAGYRSRLELYQSHKPCRR